MKIIHKEEVIIDNAKISSALNGLMFSKKLKVNQAIIIKRERESILDSAIHMLFVFQKLKIIWLNENKEVVDVKTARPFISFLKPKKPAKYIIEMCPENKLVNNLIGEKLEFTQKLI